MATRKERLEVIDAIIKDCDEWEAELIDALDYDDLRRYGQQKTVEAIQGFQYLEEYHGEGYKATARPGEITAVLANTWAARACAERLKKLESSSYRSK